MEQPSSITHLGTDDAKIVAASFFVHCHSFKDWLKRKYPTLNDPIEDYITATPALALAADYANSQKHAGIDEAEPQAKRRRGRRRGPRTGHQIDRITFHLQLDLLEGGPSSRARLRAEHNGRQVDVLNLAEACVAAWDTFVTANGIAL